MVKKGDSLKLKIESLSAEGMGIARTEGFVIMVPRALPGEVWHGIVDYVSAHYASAKPVCLESEPSEHRIKVPCSHDAACGGCSLLHMDSEMQAQMKQDNVAACFARIANLPKVPIRPILTAEETFYYRNKSLFPFAQSPHGAVFGMYGRNSHRLVETPDCLLASPLALAAANAVRDWANQYAIPAYDEKSHAGLLRYVMVRSNGDLEAMVVVVTRDAKLPYKQELLAMLHEAVPNLVSVYHNINPQRTNVALGKDFILLDGEAVLRQRLGEAHFLLDPRSFFQVNTGQTVRLYDQVKLAADLRPGQVVFDAYCGVGSIGQYLVRGTQDVQLYGLEIVSEAVELAGKNAQINGIAHASYQVGAAEELFPAWVQKGIHPDCLIVDPPRKGCHPDFIAAAAALKAPKLVYVSCNPATLARDCKLFAEAGYHVQWAQPVDMFPQTDGVETVALLTL